MREGMLDRYAYQGLVSRLEAQSLHSPAAFRSHVLLISLAAYAALFVLLGLIALAIYLGFTWAQEQRRFGMVQIGLFAVTMIPVFYAVLRTFFMRLPPPQGRPIHREEAPRLFAVLDKMRRKLKGPPIHHVLINDAYNAAVCQLPRWGLWGGHTNYLILGLPYLLGVPANEMLATVAHEYGHLCGNHGKISAWVYRQRRTFGALYEQVCDNRDDNWVHGLLASALDRFMPYYNAYTFVLSRQNEYEADRTATDMVGAKANASGLIRDELLGRWIQERFWSTIFEQANTRPRPVIFPFASMRTAFKVNFDEWATRERLAQAWQVPSGVTDTHPSLRDRVEATGQPSSLPAPVDVTAAEVLLGASTTRRLVDEFDQAWWKTEQKEWEARHRHVQRSQQRLRELAQSAMDSLPLHDLQELALLKAEFESAASSKPVLEHLLRKPGGPFPKASYFYGRILLDEDNERGLDYLETAARHDRSLVESAARSGYFYLDNKRGEEAARAWWERIVPQEEEAA